jgi:transglutaminase-like putative cysteine protease
MLVCAAFRHAQLPDGEPVLRDRRARRASAYLGDIGVPVDGAGDFSAWFEALLECRWHTLDARHNKPRIGRVLMTRGRDRLRVSRRDSTGWVRYHTETA